MTDEEIKAIERLKSIDENTEEYDGNLFKTDFETVLNLIQKQKEEIEKKDKWINKLENKLMYALTPTKHELAKRTQNEFKEIIRENIDEDTYTIKRKLKENWNNL